MFSQFSYFWRVILLAVIAGTVLFLALKPQMPIDHLVLPRTWRRFLAEHDFLNNFGAFFLLSLLSIWTAEGKVRVTRLLPMLAGVVVLLELAQFFLPKRIPDLTDVIAGGSGIALAGWMVCSARKQAGRVRAISFGQKPR